MKTVKVNLAMSLMLMLVACQEKKQLTEMHDSTAQMNTTTSNMDKKMGEMSATTTEVGKESHEMNGKMSNVVGTADKTLTLMGELYDSSRQGQSLDLRRKIWDAVVSEKALDAKIVGAGEYFLAFEFEVWSSMAQDTQENRRDQLAKDAVTELFNNLKLVSHWDENEINPFANPESRIKSGEYLSSGETLNEKAVFNALSAALHKINRKQEFAAGKAGIEVLSMFSVIEKSLKAGVLIKAGQKRLEDFPVYVDEVLRNESLAIRLLQARYNMMGLILMARVSKISESFTDGFSKKILGKKWVVDLAKLNQSQVRFYTAHLTEALKTRQLLTDIGVKAELNKDIRKILSNLALLNVSSADSAGEISDLARDRISFADGLQKYLK